MIKLTLPVDEKMVRTLKVGDEISLNGRLVTGRDAVHAWLAKEKPQEIRDLLQNTMIYHCGPVVKKKGDSWEFVAAGPTTSIREEPYQSTIMKEYGLRGVIGKGGMGKNTLKTLQKIGAVYLHAIGGLATLIAESVVGVHTVIKLEEFGTPEALWVIDVKDFLTIVTMDSHGNSLHDTIFEKSNKRKQELLKKPFTL